MANELLGKDPPLFLWISYKKMTETTKCFLLEFFEKIQNFKIVPLQHWACKKYTQFSNPHKILIPWCFW